VPFAFDETFYKPDHFTTGDNHWRSGVRWQTWNHRGEPLGLKFERAGSVNEPLVTLSVYAAGPLSPANLADLADEIRYRYNFDLDLIDFYDRFYDDPLLGPIINRHRGLRPGHPSSLYEYLMIGLVLQNATVRRSAQMFQTLLEKYGTRTEFDGQSLWCFWSPGALAQVSEDDLRALKVGYRAKSIKRIDDQFAQGLADEMAWRRLDARAQTDKLLELYGVGPATVWYILFDVFHRWDVFNYISPWEQKIYGKLFFNRDSEKLVPVPELLEFIGKYVPYQHLAVHYLWEDLWWRHRAEPIPWLAKEIRD
jgi:3-methyladenine DNA glycosylase/8-oxoguanine DNA glycosylase